MQIHSCIPTHKYPHIRSHKVHSVPSSCAYRYPYTHLHTHIHTCILTSIHAYIHIYIHNIHTTCMHGYICRWYYAAATQRPVYEHNINSMTRYADYCVISNDYSPDLEKTLLTSFITHCNMTPAQSYAQYLLTPLLNPPSLVPSGCHYQWGFALWRQDVNRLSTRTTLVSTTNTQFYCEISTLNTHGWFSDLACVHEFLRR